MLFHTFGLGNGELDRCWKKQGLAGDVSLHELPFQIFKEKTFMGGMLIDHQEVAVFRLAEDVEIVVLADDLEAMARCFCCWQGLLRSGERLGGG
jgi:hypothetical protein